LTAYILVGFVRLILHNKKETKSYFIIKKISHVLLVSILFSILFTFIFIPLGYGWSGASFNFTLFISIVILPIIIILFPYRNILKTILKNHKKSSLIGVSLILSIIINKDQVNFFIFIIFSTFLFISFLFIFYKIENNENKNFKRFFFGLLLIICIAIYLISHNSGYQICCTNIKENSLFGEKNFCYFPPWYVQIEPTNHILNMKAVDACIEYPNYTSLQNMCKKSCENYEFYDYRNQFETYCENQGWEFVDHYEGISYGARVKDCTFHSYWKFFI